MCDQMLTITQRVLKPEWVILDFCGSITSAFAQDLDDITRKLRATAFRNIIINFANVENIDGSGLKWLLIFWVSLRRLDRKIFAYGLNKELCDVFELTHMDGFVQIYEDELQVIEQGVV